MMKERTLRVLEFTRIREMLAEGALTAAGRERCLTLEPFCDLPSVRAAQAETEFFSHFCLLLIEFYISPREWKPPTNSI